MSLSSSDPSETARITRRITSLSVAVAVVLIAIKSFALGASGSVSMLASLTDSALDLVASMGVFFAVRWAAAPPDDEHRYGHGKGEAMAALVQAGLIFASAGFIGWEAIDRVLRPKSVEAGTWAVGVILISLMLTGVLVWLQDRAVKATGSLAVASDRTHYTADLAANVVVLIGIVSGTWLRAPGLDAAAGLVVAVWLFWGALTLLKTAADHLLDASVSESEHAAITQAVLDDPRITGLHRLRTRRSGNTTLIQMHVDMDPAMTLAQAHAIMKAAEDRIHLAIPEADILIHPDPIGTTPTAPAASPWATQTQ